MSFTKDFLWCRKVYNTFLTTENRNRLSLKAIFLWGAATSSHQVEGDNTNNDWWYWEEEGRVKEKSKDACGHYALYKEDFALAKELNHNAHRFSLEWSRIEPKEGVFDTASISHYKDVIAELRKLAIEPIVTLHHFTVPIWFYKKGGWLNKDSGCFFERFVNKAVSEFGRGVKYWITINEPAVNIYYSYIEGSWPPGECSFRKAVKAFINMLNGHRLAYRAIHKLYRENGWGRPEVSVAKHLLDFMPCRSASFGDRLSTRIRDYCFNTLFINSAIKALDFIGINYYTRDFVHYAGLAPPGIFGDVCTLKHHKEAGRRSLLGWEIYPEGLYKILKRYARYNLPMLITENGIATNTDEERADFIKRHVAQIARAQNEGANVIGYLYWSLIDNFEWGHGYGPRFGLIEVDYKTKKRRVRPSAYLFSDIIKKGGLTK